MKQDHDILILMAEEQTLLSRERTMHSYMQTGLAFASIGLVIIKFLGGLLYGMRRGSLHGPGRSSHTRVGETILPLSKGDTRAQRKGSRAGLRSGKRQMTRDETRSAARPAKGRESPPIPSKTPLFTSRAPMSIIGAR